MFVDVQDAEIHFDYQAWRMAVFDYNWDLMTRIEPMEAHDLFQSWLRAVRQKLALPCDDAAAMEPVADAVAASVGDACKMGSMM